VHIDVLLITYNRPQLLAHTLNSLVAQTYPHFTVHLIDNGSQPPVDPATIPPALDVHLTRIEQNRHQVELANSAIEKMGAPIFISLADDDVWAPSTLEIVATLFAQNSDMEMLGVGFSHFDHDRSQGCSDKEYLSSFSGKLEKYDARRAALGNCSRWGIGEKVDYPTPRMGHPSFIFIRGELIKRTLSRQKEFFVKPFGDIGYVGASFNTPYIHYFDLPLGAMGATAIREGNGDQPGRRQHWQRELQYLEYTPLRAPSFANMAVEGHLKVLHDNQVCQDWDCTLRSDFFANHIAQVASDVEVTDQTMRDLEEALPFTIDALLREQNEAGEEARKRVAAECLLYIKQQLQFHAFQREVRQHKRQDGHAALTTSASAVTHPDIVHYAAWLEKTVVFPLLGLITDPDTRGAETDAAKKAGHAN
jgi:hypothetical protein